MNIVFISSVVFQVICGYIILDIPVTLSAGVIMGITIPIGIILIIAIVIVIICCCCPNCCPGKDWSGQLEPSAEI
jgi:hypothetical protein